MGKMKNRQYFRTSLSNCGNIDPLTGRRMLSATDIWRTKFEADFRNKLHDDIAEYEDISTIEGTLVIS
jgi:hypothetical protein